VDPKIDAVLLSDGLHAGFVDEGSAQQVNPAQMAPFELFAEAAARGERVDGHYAHRDRTS
jgi:hypothetical protein